MKSWILVGAFVFFCLGAKAQLFLQIEKAGSFNVIRFSIGDEVCFKLKGEEAFFRTEFIENILPEERIILFSHGMVHVDSLVAIRLFDRAKWSKPLGLSLINFGLGWGIFSLGAALVSTPLTLSTAIVVSSAVTTGWLIRKLYRYKTYRFKKRRRLRILDLRIEPVNIP